jgi:hypothetical protein
MWDFVVDKVALGQVFSEYFGFPCQSSLHQVLHNHSHLSSGACTIGQKWPVPWDLVPPHLIKKGYLVSMIPITKEELFLQINLYGQTIWIIPPDFDIVKKKICVLEHLTITSLRGITVLILLAIYLLQLSWVRPSDSLQFRIICFCKTNPSDML